MLADAVPVALMLLMGIAVVAQTTCVPAALAVQNALAVSVPTEPPDTVAGAAHPVWGAKKCCADLTLPAVSIDWPGVAVPTPKRLLVLSQKKFVASLDKPEPLENCTEPVIPDAAAPAVAHVPSPRQKVVADAPVPPPRFVTGRLPETWDDKLMAGVAQTICVPPALDVQKLLPVKAPMRGSETVCEEPDAAMLIQLVLSQNCMTA